jgi:RNA polymerase sigma-70 factor (ECF subfamily)
MNPESNHTTQILYWLDRLNSGDDSAREWLIEYSCGRLYRLARKLIKSYPVVRRWEETQDVVQDASLRLHRALEDIHPESVKDFIGLAATQIRRQLIDLSRHYKGPQGMAAHHSTNRAIANPESSEEQIDQGPADDTAGPATINEWTEFHSLVERLPLEQHQVFDLHYYCGISHADAAKLLNISEKTVKRRWVAAKLMLHNMIKGEFPEI